MIKLILTRLIKHTEMIKLVLIIFSLFSAGGFCLVCLFLLCLFCFDYGCKFCLDIILKKEKQRKLKSLSIFFATPLLYQVQVYFGRNVEQWFKTKPFQKRFWRMKLNFHCSLSLYLSTHLKRSIDTYLSKHCYFSFQTGLSPSPKLLIPNMTAADCNRSLLGFRSDILSN